MSPTARRRVLITAAAAVFANFLAFLGLAPLYPNVAHDLGLNVDSLGLYFGLTSAVGAILQIPAGVIADRVGRRPVLIAGMFFMALAQVLRWQAATTPLFALSQLALGLCSPFVVAVSYAVVADAFTHRRAAALGVLQAAINVGQVTGFVAAGVLGPSLGWRGYSLVVAALPVLLLPLAMTMPEPPRAATPRSIREGTIGALRFLALPAATALALVAAVDLGAGVTAGYLLPFVARMHGFGAGATSLLLVPSVAGSVIGAPLIGGLADRVGGRLPMIISLAAAALSLGAFGVVGFSIPAVIACYFLAGAAISSVLGIAASSIAELAARSGVGTGAALGGLRVGQQLGPAVGPALTGFIYVRAGSTAAFLGLAAVLLLSALAAVPATPSSPLTEPDREPTEVPVPHP